MLLSQSCMYGIRAALLVSARAGKDRTNYLPISHISDGLDISFYFLTKVLQVLTNAKIMESYKGPNGGVRLARAAETIYLMDIVEAVDGTSAFEGCVIGLPDCSDDKPCPLHKQCGQAMKQLQKMLRDTSLGELTKETERFLYRL